MALSRFESTPRFQRLIQRMQSLTPEQKAIFSASPAYAGFGAREMQNRLRSLETAANLKAKQQSLDLAKQEMDTSYVLEEEAKDFRKGQQRLGTAIAIANIPIAGILGYKQAQRDKAEAALNMTLKKKLLGGLT